MLFFRIKIFLRLLNKRKCLYYTSVYYHQKEYAESDTIGTLTRIARYRLARDARIRIEFLELPFPKDAINR